MVIIGAAAALSFVRRLKSSYPQIYGSFRQIIRVCGIDKLDDPAVVSLLENLFQSHDDLLTDYWNLFAPEFRQSLSSPQKNNIIHDADRNELGPCIRFVNKLNVRFIDEPGTVRKYVNVISALSKGELSIDAAYNEIVIIFGDKNKDLVDEFEFVLGDVVGRRKIKKKRKLSSTVSSSADEIKSERQKTLDYLKKKKKRKSALTKDEEEEIRRQKALHDFEREQDDIYELGVRYDILELDVRLDLVRTTIKSAKKLMEILESAGNQQKDVEIVKYFSAQSLICIRKEHRGEKDYIDKETLCERRANNDVETMWKNPKIGLPKVLLHLETKEKELELAMMHKRRTIPS